LDLKKSQEGVLQSDMYQAYAYAREFDCPHVILLYPRFGKLDRNVAGYQLHPGDGVSCVDVKTIDVSQTVSQVRRDLTEIVQAALGEHNSDRQKRSRAIDI
ncbi:MAG: McrC family protein, partial [bacterium]|nr:McrC family protein [bacterium]